MFRIVAEPTFTHPVEVLTPVDGGHRKETFKATFRVLPSDEVDKFDLGTTKGGIDFLRAAIIRMDELEDENARPVPYSEAVRDALLGMTHVRIALGRTYWDAVNKAALGNSNGPAAHG